MRVPVLTATLLLALICLFQPAAAAAASRLPDSYTDAERALLRRAFEHGERRQWAPAVALAEQVRDPLPVKFFTWWRLVSGDGQMRFADYARFIQANPDWPRREGLRAFAEKAMNESVSDQLVLDWFGQHPPESEDGRIRYADALLARGDIAKATDWYRYVWQYNDLSNRNWRELYDKWRPYLRQRDNLIRVDRLLWEGQASLAWPLLGVLTDEERLVAEARVALMRDAGDADQRVAKVPADLQTSPGLVYERARWRRRHGQDAGAQELLLALPGDHGQRPEKWWEERAIQVRNLLAQARSAEAYRIASGHGQLAGTAQHAEAEWIAGWIAFRFLSQPALAGEHFGKMHEAVNYPVSRARAAYWRARVSAALGQASHAARWYRLAAQHSATFYGQLATEALERQAILRLQPTIVPNATQWNAFQRRDVVAATALLGELQQWQLFRAFVLQLAEDAKKPIEHVMVGALVRHYQRYDIGLRAAKLAARSGQQVVEYGYPLFRLPKVEAEHALVFAVMRQESEFRATATSPVGARGLMQLMPNTAREVARDMGLPYDLDRLLSDPEYNVQLGSGYLRDMLREFDGSYLLAVAAYNAGPGRVRQWLAAMGDPRRDQIDPIDWIESIPFEETRNYVQRVLENLQVYRQRLAGKPTLSRLSMDLTHSSGRN
jgi:soluble lytic murein transglycosylase